MKTGTLGNPLEKFHNKEGSKKVAMGHGQREYEIEERVGVFYLMGDIVASMYVNVKGQKEENFGNARGKEEQENKDKILCTSVIAELGCSVHPF